jgi:hypothetical protein
MKVGGRSMRARGPLRLTWPRDFKTPSCHAFYMTRGVHTRSHSPKKRSEKSEKSEWLWGMGHSPGTNSTANLPLKCIGNLPIYNTNTS